LCAFQPNNAALVINTIITDRSVAARQKDENKNKKDAMESLSALSYSYSGLVALVARDVVHVGKLSFLL
jgi:hypothetical protein